MQLPQFVRARGYECMHVRDLGLLSEKDWDLLRRIREEDWTLVTNNVGEFRARYRRKLDLHAGVVFLVASAGVDAQKGALKRRARRYRPRRRPHEHRDAGRTVWRRIPRPPLQSAMTSHERQTHRDGQGLRRRVPAEHRPVSGPGPHAAGCRDPQRSRADGDDLHRGIPTVSSGATGRCSPSTTSRMQTSPPWRRPAHRNRPKRSTTN